MFLRRGGTALAATSHGFVRASSLLSSSSSFPSSSSSSSSSFLPPLARSGSLFRPAGGNVRMFGLRWPNPIDEPSNFELPSDFDPNKPYTPPTYDYVNLHLPPWDIDNIPSVTPGQWTPQSKRVGGIGTKLGMMGLWNKFGQKELLTVIKMNSCQVTNVNRTRDKEGNPIINLQVGETNMKVKKAKKALLVVCKKAGVCPKKNLQEFRITEDALLPPGAFIRARHFVPGQFVDIQATTKGHGFQGGMKRWGFKGQPASHGNSKTHRHIGSTGACQTPGRVWPGKKMAGQMGGVKSTATNLTIYKIDVERDLLFIRGSTPGTRGATMRIVDSKWKAWNPESPPPFPTHVPVEGEEDIDEIVMDLNHCQDPFSFV